jgi:hypothetical protein
MKPKKKILLYCADDARREELSYAIWARCVWAKVYDVSTAEGFSNALASGIEFDCIVLVPSWKPREKAWIHKFLMAYPDATRAIEVRAKSYGEGPSLAGRRVVDGDMASLIDAMKTASARKRGPRQFRMVAA